MAHVFGLFLTQVYRWRCTRERAWELGWDLDLDLDLDLEDRR